MTPEQKQLVRKSWARLLPVKDDVAALFYRRLFERYPEVRAYFRGDMTEQGRKLMNMLDTAVNSLDDLHPLNESLQEMGKRHVAYGVKDEDYAKVAEALVWTLAQFLGNDFTADVKAAWIVTYARMVEVMKAGAAESAED
jgi:hemoglobin-like flavoprotein